MYSVGSVNSTAVSSNTRTDYGKRAQPGTRRVLFEIRSRNCGRQLCSWAQIFAQDGLDDVQDLEYGVKTIFRIRICDPFHCWYASAVNGVGCSSS